MKSTTSCLSYQSAAFT